MKINDFLKTYGYTTQKEINSFGLINSNKPKTLSYLVDEKYINQLNSNHNICAVFTSKELESFINCESICVNDPLVFFELFKTYNTKNKLKIKSEIKSPDLISDSAYVDLFNVKIGQNTIIHPNVTILSDVTIGDNCVVLPGAVIGSEGAEFKKINNKLTSIHHDGMVIIGNDVTIGANTCIDKGIFGNTVISNNVKMDNLCHIAHNVYIEENCYIIANSTICGSTSIGSDTWLSPSSTIINGVRIGKRNLIGLGTVQFKSTNDDQTYLGNPAKRIK